MACRPEVKKSVDLFVMSHCPYGTKAILAVKEFADTFGADAAVQVHFIGDTKHGELTSMHGPDEVADDLREVCAVQHYSKGQKFLEFLAFNAQDAAGIQTSFCKANPGLPGCEKQLSASPVKTTGAASCN